MNKDEKLNKQIYEYFDKEIPEPDENELLRLKTELAKPKPQKSRLILWKKFAIAAMVLLVLSPAVFVPIILSNQKQYYYDNDLNMVQMQEVDAKNAISNYVNDCDQLFDICTLLHAHGYYINDKLITATYSFEKNDIPFTSVTLQIDFNKNYVNNNRTLYKYNATITEHANYTLYEKQLNENDHPSYLKLLEYRNYIVYLSLNFNDNEIFQIFL